MQILCCEHSSRHSKPQRYGSAWYRRTDRPDWRPDVCGRRVYGLDHRRLGDLRQVTPRGRRRPCRSAGIRRHRRLGAAASNEGARRQDPARTGPESPGVVHSGPIKTLAAARLVDDARNEVLEEICGRRNRMLCGPSRPAPAPRRATKAPWRRRSSGRKWRSSTTYARRTPLRTIHDSECGSQRIWVCLRKSNKRACRLVDGLSKMTPPPPTTTTAVVQPRCCRTTFPSKCCDDWSSRGMTND